MKKFLFTIMAIATILVITSCAEEKTIDGITYTPYGLLNETTAKNDSIQYQVSGGSIVVGIVFSETIIVPVYVFGYDLFEPIGLKKDYADGKIKGVVK